MDRSTFLEHLRQTHLLTDEQIDEAAGQFSESDPVQGLARAFIARGLLTRYQAKQLLAGKPQELLLGHYRLLDPLGRTDASRVFKAFCSVRNRLVALKALLPEVLEREIAVATRLSHPYIIAICDQGEDRGVHFLVMEYVEGPNLEELVRRQGPLPVGLACELMRQTAEALRCLHEKEIVHRDIRPVNILLSPGVRASRSPGAKAKESSSDSRTPGRPDSWTAKLIDFGRARLEDADTVPDAPPTDSDYASPEDDQDAGAVDARSDLYSLGCTFHYALTGRPPFPGSPPTLSPGGRGQEEPNRRLPTGTEPLTRLRPDLPAAVAAVVQRLLVRDPARRYQSAADLIDDLTPWCGRADLPPAAPKAPPLGPAELATNSVEANVSGPAEQEPVPSKPEPDKPPTRRKAVRVDPALRQGLQQWTAIVRRFMRGRGAKLHIRQEAYRKLHDRLVEACRSQAGDAERAEDYRLFWKLGEMIRPWVTLESLAGANREVLADLLIRCEQAEQEFAGRKKGRRLVVLLLLLAVLVGGGAVLFYVNQTVAPVAETLQDGFAQVWERMRNTMGLPWWLLVGGILVLFFMWVVSRTARS